MPTPSTTKTTLLTFPEPTKRVDFDAIKLRIASPENIRYWSHGEVTKPETINYRTQKPEMDGLFCERIFGPIKDWECYCGKYKRVRYKGIVCDKCGVEVTRSLVRRERLGHIDLAAPVAHIWFTRGVPSRIALMLNVSPQNLEKVIYFASFIIIAVNEDLKKETLGQVTVEFKNKKKSFQKELQQNINRFRAKAKSEKLAQMDILKGIENLERAHQVKTEELEKAWATAKQELLELKPLKIFSEITYQDLSLKYGHIFEAGIGAEAVEDILKKVDLDKEIKQIDAEYQKAPQGRKPKLKRRLRLINNFKNNKMNPDWMILNAIPVIPPDLRPMVQLDGGRFAASDLNDLYRRVINRNNRLKRLKELNAPEVICRNEKRMLQEAVDALIDNGARRGKTVTASTGQKRVLKSIADMLKGKQGRFRQNLLGKRVDYSGRSVIVVGPNLTLDQCGLPRIMALELFRPFVISKLIKEEVVHNVRSANRFIESSDPKVWDILESITRDAHVLLNRAPTLHRLGIQSFKPVLIEGKAIQLHPLVCAAFNADFDGDQMAVHIPLTAKAKCEAKNIMLSSLNILKPATSDPITYATQDMVLGCYYLTTLNLDADNKKTIKAFSSANEAEMSFQLNKIKLQEKIKIKIKDKIIKTSIGRIIFNQILPKEIGYINQSMERNSLRDLVGEVLEKGGLKTTVKFLDALKNLGFRYLTKTGASWGINDLPEVPEREPILEESQKEVEAVESQYNMGLLAPEEKHAKIIEIWAEAKEKITAASSKTLSQNVLNPVYSMISSKARGSWGQLTQMMGMKGLVTSPSGETIELPVKANFKGGFDVLEYFISTHGARKGLTDTALRTANAGYLTRRLVDVAQDLSINTEDCQDKEGIELDNVISEEIGKDLKARIKGRFILEDIRDPKGGKVLVKKDTLITGQELKKLKNVSLDKIKIRSVISCKLKDGICQKCYGWDLAFRKLVDFGTAIGIVAAQSIGEPGTQLTMRTFHTGGVAGQDITQGLPRVEEIFEARNIKKGAVISEITGQIKIEEKNKQVIICVESQDKKTKKEYPVPSELSLMVRNGDLVNQGDKLTEGSIDLRELYRLKGQYAVQRYIISEIQKIYSSQGQDLHDKHIEVIARQLFSRVHIVDSGDSHLVDGDILERAEVLAINENIKKKKGKEVKFEVLLLGMTKTALSTSSFLSAASFQETARILIGAAVSGKIDKLRGLKENVIIGRLIPMGTGFKQGAQSSKCLPVSRQVKTKR